MLVIPSFESIAHVLSAIPNITAVKVPGAHALNFSAPELVAELIAAHISEQPLATETGPRSVVEVIDVEPPPGPGER